MIIVPPKMESFMRLFIRASLAALCLCATALIASTTASAQTSDHQYSSADIEAGSRVYVANCALCHGRNGSGVDGIDLRRGLFRTAHSDDDIRRVVTEGAANSRMPSFDLQQSELNGLVAYIRAGFDPSGVAIKVGDPTRGQAIFEGKGRCSQCHRVNGNGRRLAPDLSDIGAIRTPAALERTMVAPDSALLPINRPVRAVTRSGETIRGRRLNEDTYTVQLIDSNEKLRSLVKSDLTQYEVSTTATMRPTTLSAGEIADVIGYLLSLRGLP
jgi:cytochrome c oxidase cbb3-type subunit III